MYLHVVSTATTEGGVRVVLSEVTGTETNVTGLTPDTNYTFSVTAENAVSSQDTNINDRTATFTTTTLEGGMYNYCHTDMHMQACNKEKFDAQLKQLSQKAEYI